MGGSRSGCRGQGRRDVKNKAGWALKYLRSWSLGVVLPTHPPLREPWPGLLAQPHPQMGSAALPIRPQPGLGDPANLSAQLTGRPSLAWDKCFPVVHLNRLTRSFVHISTLCRVLGRGYQGWYQGTSRSRHCSMAVGCPIHTTRSSAEVVNCQVESEQQAPGKLHVLCCMTPLCRWPVRRHLH